MAQINLPESCVRTLYARYGTASQDWAVNQGVNVDLSPVPADRYVVKPDHAIGKRGKRGLIGINLTDTEVREFISQKSGLSVDGTHLRRFIVSPFVPHTEEYYVSITALAESDQILLSPTGGIDIEEHWDSVRMIKVPVEEATLPKAAQAALAGFPKEISVTWIASLLDFFRYYNLSFLEINPLVVFQGKPLPLDFKARIDTCATFQMQKHTDIESLIESAREEERPEEAAVRTLDSLTDASLKLKTLNPQGRIWPLVAGGGASIVYFDALVDMGLSDEIGFYGEYSGNPPQDLTYQYADIVLNMLVASNTKDKVLLIAGANANFTDIAATFKGISQALEEHAAELVRQRVKIIVRRGGPNVELALRRLRELGERTGLDIRTHGATVPLCGILEEISR